VLEGLLSEGREPVRAELGSEIEGLTYFRSALGLNLPSIKAINFPADVQNREVQSQIRAYSDFTQLFYSQRPEALLDRIANLSASLKDSGLCRFDGTLAGPGALVASPAFAAMREFITRNPEFPETPARNSRQPTQAQWDLFREWGSITSGGRGEIEAAFSGIARLNFYLTAANTVAGEKWCRVERSKTPGEVVIRDGLNIRLATFLGREQVTLNEVTITPDRSIQLLSGTNGGGKTQYMQMLGSMLIFAESIGYLPAASARIGDIPYFEMEIAGGEHSEEHSSFQNEILRIREIVERCEQAGRGGVLVIDEPFKGTSEDEAAPLLIGLLKYCADRDIKLLCSTHFSSVFDRLAALADKLSLRAVPLFVDYFSQTERFKVRGGIGLSSGIRVAEELGLAPEIVATARAYARKAFPAQY
jgi:hypothetical protein